MDAEKTKAVAAIEATMRQVPPGSYRYQVLASARDFKGAWVALGRHLTSVRDGALYKDWGYEDFETYCQRELHIRKATAHKLTATYAFMHRHEPALVQRVEAEPEVPQAVPPFEVVQVLSRAEALGQIGDAEYRQVRDRVFDERPPSAASLARTINGKWPPPPKPEALPEAKVRRLSNAARRLADDAGRCKVVPRALRDRAEALAEDFATLLDEGPWREVG